MENTTPLRSAAQGGFSLSHAFALVLKLEYPMTEGGVVSTYLDGSYVFQHPGDDLWTRCTERREKIQEKSVFLLWNTTRNFSEKEPGDKEAKWKWKSPSHVRLFVTPWTAACQAPLSMEFSRQEHLSGLPFHSPEDLPDPEMEPSLPHCRQILYRLSYWGSPKTVFNFLMGEIN